MYLCSNKKYNDMVRWIGLALMTSKNMFSSSDRQTEIIKRVQREYLNLRKKLVISFNWG